MPASIHRVAPADWPTLAPFIHQHNRRADGSERCLHAHQGDTPEQHAHELVALVQDEAAFWLARDAAGEPVAVIGCDFDPALRRAWVRGPVVAGDPAAHPGLMPALVDTLQDALPDIRCFDAFPDEGEPALNALYADCGYQRLGVHRVMEAALAPDKAGEASTAWPLVSGISVRQAQSADLPALIALHTALFPNGYLKDSDFADSLVDPARHLLVCSDAGGHLLGYLHAKDAPEQPEVYIDYLGTAPEARGQGLGRALLAGALAWGRTLGRPRASLTVREDRAPALALYERSGFREVSAGVHWRREKNDPVG